MSKQLTHWSLVSAYPAFSWPLLLQLFSWIRVEFLHMEWWFFLLEITHPCRLSVKFPLILLKVKLLILYLLSWNNIVRPWVAPTTCCQSAGHINGSIICTISYLELSTDRCNLRLQLAGTIPANLILQLTTAFREGGLRDRSGTFSYKDHIHKLNVPVLALAGDRDFICPPEAVEGMFKLKMICVSIPVWY